MDTSNIAIPNTKVKKGKGLNTRRKWTKNEESVLMGLFKELLASGGWKSENGFMPGYLQKLEEKLRENLPGTDLRGNPHINSKITTWKRHHQAIQTALADSGGGFNTETKILDVSDIAWEKVVAKESSVANLRYKPWSFYYDWLEVFGNDGATGGSSQTVMDVVNDLIFEEAAATEATSEHQCQGQGINTPNEDSNCDMDVESQAPSSSVQPSKQQCGPSSTNKRASPSTTGNNRDLLDGLDVLFKTSDDRLADIVHSMVVEQPVQPIDLVPTWPKNPTCSRSDVFRILETIPELTLDEQLDASNNILKYNDRWELFSGLPDHARERYVRRLLNGDFD